MIARLPDRPAAATVFLETFGCQMNVLDSQLVKGQLSGLGYRFVDDWQTADIVLYNTCSVREHAESKVYSRVGRVGVIKQQRPHMVLGVVGCMAEREGVELLRRYPQIDLLCGPGELDRLPLLIDNALKTRIDRRPSQRMGRTALAGNTHRRSTTFAAAEDRLEMLDLARSFSPDDYQGSAYVRITRGCNKFCTYCVVPRTRGAEVHRPPDNIISECKRLVDAGVVEITLLGQTVNHYHFKPLTDFHPIMGATTFANLLGRIHDEVPDLQRLRFVTSFPRDFGDDILRVMRDKPRICRYLHLPVQSGSDRILKQMNRGYTVSQYEALLDRIRHHLPDALIASDIICGFATETLEDHSATCDLLTRARFKNCYIFKYSPRPGTSAIDRFDDDVVHEEKRRRNNELLAIQAQISADVHGAFIGKTVRVFVESVSARTQRSRNTADRNVNVGWQQDQAVTQLSGRTSSDMIVMFEGDETLVGSIVDIEIERSAPLALFGRLVPTPVPT